MESHNYAAIYLSKMNLTPVANLEVGKTYIIVKGDSLRIWLEMFTITNLDEEWAIGIWKQENKGNLLESKGGNSLRDMGVIPHNFPDNYHRTFEYSRDTYEFLKRIALPAGPKVWIKWVTENKLQDKNCMNKVDKFRIIEVG